ncbi:ATP-binding protein [Candidatus Micrarchaeota archaeon]|nr:ATP-binding protein [Candidatus Micrarchaeota archaeon]
MSDLGIVISLEGSPSTAQFSFVIDPKNGNGVRKGQYIQTKSEDGVLFGYVNEIVRANRYFERAESIAEYERMGKIEHNFPVSSWEYMIAEVRILGTYNEGRISRSSIPPYPGSKVAEADEDMLRKFLGFDENTGLEIGNLLHHELKAKLNLTKLLQKHLAILAMSGAGKSHLMSVLIEELLERNKESGRVAVVVIDIHGEYSGFRHDKNYGTKTKVVEGKSISFPFRKLSPNTISEWFPEMSIAGKSLLSKIIKEMKREAKDARKDFTLKDLNERLNTYPAKENIKDPIRRVMGELRGIHLITRRENPKLRDDVKAGNMLVFDLSDLDNMKKKRMIVSYIAKALFNLRKKEKIPPFLLVVEEAHNFATEKMDKYSNISKSIIEKIAREGRKFGACLCLISQRPVNLSTTALSQCNTHIILRVTNPNDLQHIGESSEGIDGRMLRSITSLQVGEGIIVGEAVKCPIFVGIRDRKSKKREKGRPLEQQALDFEETNEKKSRDVEAFL